MTILLCLLIGTFVGWLTAAYADLDEGIFLCMLMGALGGVLGGRLLSTMLWDSPAGIYKILLTIFGAVFLSLIGRVLAASRRDAV